MSAKNIIYHNATVTRERRNQLNRHKSIIIWCTGLSGSGKSTLAHAVEEELFNRGCRTYVLDGDNVRHGLYSNLGFADKDKDIYKIVASRSHMSDETKAFIENIRTHKEKETISIGSSLKICLVAEGEADLYPRLGPTMEWDTGAANVIASESKCRFRGYSNNIYSEFFYNKKSLLNSSFIVDR
jgi:3'-phosphoadenosine 5'-phosphosulfate (PAPS) 3'-phosphatase